MLWALSEHNLEWKVWMVITRTTRILAPVNHKHKHISNLVATPVDTVVTTAKNLAKALKGKLTHYLQELSLVKLTHLSRIFSNASVNPEADLTPHSSVEHGDTTSDITIVTQYYDHG